MTAAVYAARYRRVRLKDPTRARETFTAARARGEKPASDRPGAPGECERWYFPALWLWSA